MAELGVLLSFPPDDHSKLSPKKYDDLLQNYFKRLEKIPHTAWTRSLDKKNLLDMLNPEVNSIPYLFALNAHIKAAGINETKKLEALINYALIFAATFDPIQIRYVGEEWRTQIEWLLDTLPRFGSMDLSPITSAMLRLDPTSGTFTSIHLRLLRACLALGTPSTALPILDKNIYALPTTPPKNVPDDLLSEDHELSNSFITPKSGFTLKLQSEYILEYYLLGAHVYIGTHNFPRARLFLEYVLLTPSIQHTVSAMQVEAYKRWVLVGLLAEGKPYPHPRTNDAGAMRAIRAVAKPYDALAESFEKREWTKYMAEMDVGAAVWHEDGNLRLVREAGDALLRYRVIDLQKTYAALPLSRVATHMGFTPEQTLGLVTEMIRARHLMASLTPAASGEAQDAVLRFHTTSSREDHDLEAQTKRIEDLISFVRDADRRLQLTKEYSEYVKRTKRSGPDADLADQMDLSWDNGGGGSMMGGGDFGAPIMVQDDDEGDEDLMGG
ncbi:hypothetical protein LTR53_006585 [Teratosphaeriaceae sp. CCFEE 6253]|nr:hypothetical protein LTR53_006585 [Teratosphaeriaceae sp. CCFEE 6253]